MAVSIAAHGLLLLSLQAPHPTALQSPAGSTFRVHLLRPAKASPKPVAATSSKRVTTHAHASPKPAHRVVSHRQSVRHSEVAARKAAPTPVVKKRSPGAVRKVASKAQKPTAISGTVERSSGSAAAQLSASAAKARERRARESRVRNHLERYKYYPVSARRHGIEGEVELDFALNQQGQARSLSIVSGSGYAVLDDAALRTVRRAQPFPASGGEYRFRLRFSRL